MNRLPRRFFNPSAWAVLGLGVVLTACGPTYDPVNPPKPWMPPGAQAAPEQNPPLSPVEEAQTPAVPDTDATPEVPDVQLPEPGTLGAGGGSVLREGDFLRITFSDITPLPPPHEVRIRPDGTITLPFNEVLQAAGKSVRQLEEEILKAYVPKYYRRLTVTVTTTELFYFVGGEVRLPNRQIYLGKMTVTRAIDTAGGFTDFARKSRIELRRANGQTVKVNYEKAIEDPTKDPQVFPGDQIYVPKRGPFW